MEEWKRLRDTTRVGDTLSCQPHVILSKEEEEEEEEERRGEERRGGGKGKEGRGESMHGEALLQHRSAFCRVTVTMGPLAGCFFSYRDT